LTCENDDAAEAMLTEIAAMVRNFDGGHR